MSEYIELLPFVIGGWVFWLILSIIILAAMTTWRNK